MSSKIDKTRGRVNDYALKVKQGKMSSRKAECNGHNHATYDGGSVVVPPAPLDSKQYRSSIGKIARESRDYAQSTQESGTWHIEHGPTGPRFRRESTVQAVGYGGDGDGYDPTMPARDPIRLKVREYKPRPNSVFKTLRTNTPVVVVVKRGKL